MAFNETQSAFVIDSLIADIIQESISIGSQQLLAEAPKGGTCQKLVDIFGLKPCGTKDEDTDIDDLTVKDLDAVILPHPLPIDRSSDSSLKERSQPWYSWLIPALAHDSSGDESEIYKRNVELKVELSDTACQTEQPRFRTRRPRSVTPGDRAALLGPAPCELNRQTIFIDAHSAPTPGLQARPPMTDRFCYMLTDFASALYCSLAIMCCCTPSMFR